MTTPINSRNGWHDREAASAASSLSCEDESLAVQSQAYEADINNIVRDFGVTGMLPQVLNMPRYGDFEGISDYHEAQTLLALAQSSFLALPSSLRAMFNHDPSQLIAFAEDPANEQALLDLGIERIPERSLIRYSPPSTAGEREANKAPPTPPPAAETNPPA